MIAEHGNASMILEAEKEMLIISKHAQQPGEMADGHYYIYFARY